MTPIGKLGGISMLSPSEAIYGFAGWLTSRREVTTMSASHDAAGIAELVDEFVKRNALPEPRENWHKELIQPTQTHPTPDQRREI